MSESGRMEGRKDKIEFIASRPDPAVPVLRESQARGEVFLPVLCVCAPDKIRWLLVGHLICQALAWVGSPG
jgi:hypothetical protein